MGGTRCQACASRAPHPHPVLRTNAGSYPHTSQLSRRREGSHAGAGSTAGPEKRKEAVWRPYEPDFRNCFQIFISQRGKPQSEQKCQQALVGSRVCLRSSGGNRRQARRLPNCGRGRKSAGTPRRAAILKTPPGTRRSR